MKVLEKYKIDLQIDSQTSARQVVLSLLETENRPILLDLGSGDYKRLTLRAVEKVDASEVITTDIIGTGLVSTGNRDGRPYTHVTCDLNELFSPYVNGIDVIIASQIIEHLWNTDQFLREMLRVLKPGGYAIISTPNLASWHNVAYLLMGKQPETATVSDELYPWKEKPGHVRIFTATELIKLLEFHGFIVERVVGSSYYPFMGRAAKLLSRLDWKHASNITVKGRKNENSS